MGIFETLYTRATVTGTVLNPTKSLGFNLVGICLGSLILFMFYLLLKDLEIIGNKKENKQELKEENENKIIN